MTTHPSQQGTIGRAFHAAFPYTIPILTSFIFLGLTYGIYMRAAGFSFWYPMLMSLTIFAGSVEFVAANLLLGAFHPLQALALTLMINARHLFTASLCWTSINIPVGKSFISSSVCVTKAFP